MDENLWREEMIPGWFSEKDMESYRFLVSQLNNEIFVEVGSYLGRSLSSIIPVCKEKNLDVFCIDLWELHAEEFEKFGSEVPTRQKMKENIEAIDKDFSFDMVQCPSVTAAEVFMKSLGKESIGGVFIDAGHDFDSVRNDILAWMPLVRKGGWIGGHDFCRGWKEVGRAVRDVFGSDYKRLPSTIWWSKI